jgi:hypothetical protein
VSLRAGRAHKMSPLVPIRLPPLSISLPAFLPIFPQGALAQAVPVRGEHDHPLLSTQPT